MLLGTVGGSTFFSAPFSGMRKLPKSVELLRRPLAFLSEEERRFDESLEDTDEEEEEGVGAG